MAVLRNDISESVGYDASITSCAALKKKTALRWPYLRHHGREIVDLLLEVHSKYELRMTADVAAKALRAHATSADSASQEPRQNEAECMLHSEVPEPDQDS